MNLYEDKKHLNCTDLLQLRHLILLVTDKVPLCDESFLELEVSERELSVARALHLLAGQAEHLFLSSPFLLS